MATPTRSAALSLAKDSRVIMGNHAGARLVVASVTSTTITVNSVAELTGTALYTASAPGQVEIAPTPAAGNTHNGKTTRITGITGSVLTVTDDLSTALAAGDVITVTPPLSVELYLNQGHTLNSKNAIDKTMALGQTVLTDNTPMAVDVDGNVPFFLIPTSEGLTRLLAFAIGSYKSPSSGTHKYRPLQGNDGTFSNSEEATFYTQDGNGVVRQLFYGCFSTRLTIDAPEGGLATGSVELIGNGSAREVGGSGKTYTQGANNYIRSNFICDTGARASFRAAFVELGGTFGAGLTTATETTVKSLNIVIERGAMQDRTLGDAYIVKPEEQTFMITVTGTRILQDDSFYKKSFGAATDSEPGFKAETRLLIKFISIADTTKTLTFDIPRGLFEGDIINRQPGRFTEQFTYTMLATLDANGCVSTTTPPMECTLVSGITKNVLTAL